VGISGLLLLSEGKIQEMSIGFAIIDQELPDKTGLEEMPPKRLYKSNDCSPEYLSQEESRFGGRPSFEERWSAPIGHSRLYEVECSALQLYPTREIGD
jgi:hypothetical protein